MPGIALPIIKVIQSPVIAPILQIRRSFERINLIRLKRKRKTKYRTKIAKAIIDKAATRG